MQRQHHNHTTLTLAKQGKDTGPNTGGYRAGVLMSTPIRGRNGANTTTIPSPPAGRQPPKMQPMPTPKKYDVIVADPPWDHYGSPTKMAAAGKHYTLMSDTDMLAYPIPDLLNPSGILFLWATGPRLDFALTCINTWGLTYRGIAFVWIKTKQDGTPIGAQGVRPSIIKPLTELVLAASRITRGRPQPVASESISQTVFAPRGAHSQKPEAVQDRIEELYPNATRLELFARRHRPGWDAIGDQLP